MNVGKQSMRDRARGYLDPVVSFLSSLGIPPAAVTIAALLFGLYGALLVSRGSLFWGGVWLLLSGLSDVVDGALARKKGLVSKFGAFIDSTFDRISEFAYFGAIIIYYVSRPQGFSEFDIGVVFVALVGSILVSYTRARLEGLGFECTVGLMERAERIALLAVGLLLGSRVLSVVLFLLAAGALITFFQRVHYAYQVTRTPTERGPTG